MISDENEDMACEDAAIIDGQQASARGVIDSYSI